LPGLTQGFADVLQEARRECSTLRRTLEPYAARFAAVMGRRLLIERCALAAVGSASWDAALGPALATLSGTALGQTLGPQELRERLCGACDDAAAICVDLEAFSALLRTADVAWA